jgi:hypothetical protein
MKQRLLVVALFFCLVVAGSITYAAVDSFVLGHVDAKFAHTARDQFMLILVFGGVLAIGSLVPVVATVLALGRIAVSHRLLFASVAAVVVLALFVSGAYVPIAEWVEPVMPRNAFYAFIVSAILGGVGVLFALVACIARERASGA